MKRLVKIEVTQEIIDKSRKIVDEAKYNNYEKVTVDTVDGPQVISPSYFAACPISLAARLVLKNVFGTSETLSVLDRSGERLILIKDYELPKKARNFIDAFDVGKPVEPISFWLYE